MEPGAWPPSVKALRKIAPKPGDAEAAQRGPFRDLSSPRRPKDASSRRTACAVPAIQCRGDAPRCRASCRRGPRTISPRRPRTVALHITQTGDGGRWIVARCFGGMAAWAWYLAIGVFVLMVVVSAVVAVTLARMSASLNLDDVFAFGEPKKLSQPERTDDATAVSARSGRATSPIVRRPDADLASHETSLALGTVTGCPSGSEAPS